MKHSERRLGAARDMYKTFQEKESQKLDVVRITLDEAVYKAGRADEIIYRSGKWEKGRKTNDYVHVFDSMPFVYSSEGTSSAKKVSTLIGPHDREQIPLAALGHCLSFRYKDMDGEFVDLHFSYPPILLCTPNGKTLVIMDKNPIFVNGGQMRVEDRGIVK